MKARLALLLGIIVILGVVEIYADIALADWARNLKNGGKHWGLAAGVAIYAVVGVLYGLALLFGKLSIANTLWQVISIAIVFFLGVYMFGESPTVGQWIGLGIILIGLLCMMSGEAEVWTHPNKRFWHREWNPFPRALDSVRKEVRR